MRYQIMLNKGTNLWSFYDDGGFLYAAETEVEMAEKVRELAKTTPMDNIKVVVVLDTEAVIKVESMCPEPEPEPDPEPEPEPEDPGTKPDPDPSPEEPDPTPPETGGEDTEPSEPTE